ncbi:MAG: HTH domain-containing protein [Candidatus Hodarchaeaceae archaeon]|nr:HTH domain-containing protein [Candidatus Hodarchaeaceae archaeon]
MLELLMRTREKLSVSEITACINRSERAVRAHLKSLFNLGLVCREGSATKHGKIAHRYFVPKTKDMIKSARKEMLKRLRNLEKLVRGAK